MDPRPAGARAGGGARRARRALLPRPRPRDRPGPRPLGGLRITEARAGLAAARADLAQLEVDGVEYFLDPETADLLSACRAEARGLFLLPGFDEFVLGYGDRTAVLDPQFAGQIVPGNNGMFRPTVVRGGRILGTWKWTGKGAKRTLTAAPFTSFPASVTATIERAAARLP